NDGKSAVVAIGLCEHAGDIVACEPVIAHVRKEHPGACIVWCARKSFAELVQFHPDIDAVVALECFTEWLWLKECGVFDQAIDLHLNGRQCPVCARPMRKAGPDAVTLDNYYDFGAILPVFSRSAGLPPLDGPPRVYISSKASAEIDALLSKCEISGP